VSAGRVSDVAIGRSVIRGHMKTEAPAENEGKSTAAQPAQATQAPPRAAQKPAAQEPTKEPTQGPTQEPTNEAATGNSFETVRVDDSDLMRDLSSHGVKVTGVVESNFWKDAAGWLIPLVV